jgi:excisionase family DNA binding protein
MRTSSAMGLMTTAEVATLLRVSRRTVARWKVAGHLRAIKLPTGAVRFETTEIERLLHEDHVGVSSDTLAKALTFLADQHVVRPMCVACATRPQESDSGLCMRCEDKHERVKAQKRDWWEKNGTDARARRKEKQRVAAG